MPSFDHCSQGVLAAAFQFQPSLLESMSSPPTNEFESVDSVDGSTLSALAPSKTEPQLNEKKHSSKQTQETKSKPCTCGSNSQQSQQKSASKQQVAQQSRGHQTMPRPNDHHKPRQTFLNQYQINPPPRFLPQPQIQNNIPGFLPPLAPRVASFMPPQYIINPIVNRIQTIPSQGGQYGPVDLMNNGGLSTGFESPYARQNEFQIYTSFQNMRQDGFMPQLKQIPAAQQPAEFDVMNQMPQFVDRYATPPVRRRNITPPPLPNQSNQIIAAQCQPPQMYPQQPIMRQMYDCNTLPSMRFRESSIPSNLNRIQLNPLVQQQLMPPPQQVISSLEQADKPEQIMFNMQQQPIYQQFTPQQQQQATVSQQLQQPYQVLDNIQMRYQQLQQSATAHNLIQNGPYINQCIPQTFQSGQNSQQICPQVPSNEYQNQLMLVNNQMQQNQQQPQQQSSQQQQQQRNQNAQMVPILAQNYTNFEQLLKELQAQQKEKDAKNKEEKIVSNKSHKSLFTWFFTKPKDNQAKEKSAANEPDMSKFLTIDYKYR